MSLLTLIKAQFGKSNTAANNFVLDASADNGTMKLARGNAGATTQDILTVDAAGNINAPVSIQKAGSVLQALSDFSGTNVSLTTNGYQKLPSGLIIQWGNTGAIASSGSKSITFPISFPALCATVTIGDYGGVNSVSADSKSTSGFTAKSDSISTADAMWIAIGY